MADPLSITASIITLIQASIQVTVLIKQFRNEASAVDATLTGLLDDVERFRRVLESMRETVDQSDIKSNLQSTGHTGNHWKNLARSLNDGTDTLQKLHDLLDGINKKTSVLDTPRKLLRLKSASEQIMHYREQIQSSHTALQLSLSTIILWNQVAFQKSTEMIPDKIVPTLDKLYEEFRTFGALLNAKIEKLQLAAVDPTDLENHKLQYMNNLRECVRSAADVVSSASTTLNTDSSDKVSVRYGSDFGDIFIRDANEPMLRWFASNTVYEYEDVEAPLPAPSEASTGDALTEDNSDTDSDLENDLIRSLFEEGMKRKEQGDLTGAVRHFRNCLTRFSSKTSYASLTATQSLAACGVSKVDLLEYLTDCYCLLGSWDKAKSTMAERLAITERQVGKKDVVYLKDTMKLAEIMMMNQDYVEARHQALRSLRGFRRLGENGQASHENCLAFLIQIWQLEGKEDEEEAYTALLVGHVRGALRPVPQFQSALLSLDVVQPQSPSTLDAQAESIVGTSIPKQSQEVSLQPHETTQKNLSQDDLHAASSSLSHRPSGSDQDTKLKTKRIPDVEPIAMEVLKDALLEYPDKSSEMNALLEYQDDDISEKKPLFPPTPPLPAPGMAEESEETESAEYLEEDEKDASWDRATQSAIHPPSMTASTSTAVDTFGRVQDNKYYAPLSSFIDGRSYPIEVMEFISMLSRSSREDKIKRKRQEAMANVDFLETYCRLTYGTRPDYSTSGGPAGFTCTVSIDGQQWCTVSGYASQYQAVDAAAAKVCWEYMTTTEMVMVMEILGKPNRSSDKEVYTPYLDESHTAIPDDTPLQQAPGITITQPGQNTIALRSFPNTGVSGARSAERSRLRRYASNPSMLTEQDIGQSLVGKFLSKSYAALKVGKTHQRAAASLPKLPSDYQKSNSDLSIEVWNKPSDTHAATADGGSPASLRVSRCPVCNDSLSERTYDALSHVNKCITEQYGTIDVSQRPQDGQIQSPGALVSRPSSSSATMTSEEGLWACDQCKSGTIQYLSEKRCSYCSELRQINTPSSLNGFERDIYNQYYIPQTSTLWLPRDRSVRRIRRKVVLLGDTLCGKTWLASRWCKGQPLSHSEDTVMNNFIKTIEMEGWQVELVVWDCNGTDENEATRRLSYDNAYMVLICFDISDRDSFVNVDFMWKHEVEKYLPGVPKVLVGCKKDFRYDTQLLQALSLSRETLPVSPYSGDNLAMEMGALAYFETSAIDSKGLSELFEYVAKALLRTSLNPRNRRLRAPLSKSENQLKP